MDLSEIKQLLTGEGGKIIVVENDKPIFVVMSYEEYKGRKAKIVQSAVVEQKQEISKPSSSRELTLDDLPL